MLNNTKTNILIFVIGLFLICGCTDATIGKFKALGDSAHVTCFSGGKLIYEGCSTGKVKSESSSDGYYFQDKRTKKVMEVSGNCVIIYDSKECN